MCVSVYVRMCVSSCQIKVVGSPARDKSIRLRNLTSKSHRVSSRPHEFLTVSRFQKVGFVFAKTSQMHIHSESYLVSSGDPSTIMVIKLCISFLTSNERIRAHRSVLLYYHEWKRVRISDDFKIFELIDSAGNVKNIKNAPAQLRNPRATRT